MMIFFVRLKFKCHNMWYYLHFETNDSCKACKYIHIIVSNSKLDRSTNYGK